MDGATARGDEGLRLHVDFDLMGENLKVASTGPVMRVIKCPDCYKKYVVNGEVTHAKCRCGTRFRTIERWYEHGSIRSSGK